MKHLRYRGEFVSVGGTTWRVDIMQEADAAFATVGELTFPSDSPIVIEWSRVDKEAVVCGSTATLRVISPGDRTYEDFYSIEVGRIRMDVYRDEALYWSGMIDPEFYEEPYERLDGYEVSLTFSDFGVLDRLRYDLSGMKTLREIIEHALSQAGIIYTGIDTSLVSTTFDDDTTITDGALSVRSDNFYDEDGEASTLYEVLEGIMQPLAVRIVQRAGKIWLYDLNGLYTSGSAEAIEWDGDSQTMGTDKVANNVIVSFSPYSSSKALDDEIVYGGKYDIDLIYTSSGEPGGLADYTPYYSYLSDYGREQMENLPVGVSPVDFTIFISAKGSGLASIGTGCKYFHILPVLGGGSETTGVAYAFRAGLGSVSSGVPRWKINAGVPHGSLTGGSEILTTKRFFIPKIGTKDTYKYRVRVATEILVDARYNPLSGSTTDNEDGNDYMVKVRSAFVFIPVRIQLYDDEGNVLYHYSNIDNASNSCLGHINFCRGKWVAGADPGGHCWFEWYNPEDLLEDCGIRGWKANRHCIGRPDGLNGRKTARFYKSFKKMDDGEFLPYPPVSGYLEVQIQSGILGYDYGQQWDRCDFGSTQSSWDVTGIYDMLRWCLYKAPVVEIVNNNLVYDEAELDDIEYSGYINKYAKEEISIDTSCGTSDRVCPTAKGIYHRTATGEQLQKLKRADIVDHPEKLLIGTLYSQYASRKTTLSGEAVIDGGLHYYTEQNQSGKRFMLMSDVQNVITDCTDAEYCEFRPDEYDDIEEVN